jgi:uncharacterized protein (DUF983 family)
MLQNTKSKVPLPERPAKPAMILGWKRLCPNCGTGPIFDGYLKVRDTCPVCNEELHHQRADDGPAYLTILIAGHIMAPAILIAYENFEPDPLMLTMVFSVFFVALALYLLPRLKGGMIGLQWAKRMHGFGHVPDRPEPDPNATSDDDR